MASTVTRDQQSSTGLETGGSDSLARKVSSTLHGDGEGEANPTS